MVKKILIIDDDATHRMIYRTQIEHYLGRDFPVIEADNAEDGLKKLITESPACVVLDNSMPGFTGFHLLHQLMMTMPDHQPIIFISCTMDESLAKNAMALGAAVCMEKSRMGRDELLQAITEVT